MNFYNIFFFSLKELKTSMNKVISLILSQDIHMSDFLEEHPKNADLKF